MGSITIRQLDDALKAALRLRAATHGRSVEDEVRTILRAAAAEEAPPPAARPTSQVSTPERGAGPRGLLIIGGGMAAYKSLDLIRRLKERRLAVRCILTQAAQEFITPLAAGALFREHPPYELLHTHATL